MNDELPLAALGVPAPTPSELASLAIQLCGAGMVEKNLGEAMKRASAVWIAARSRCEIVAGAEVYRLAALADEEENASRGDMSQADVMKLDGVPRTEKQFLKRAREFYQMDWAAVVAGAGGGQTRFPWVSGLNAKRPTLAFFAGIASLTKSQKRAGAKTLPPAERRWQRVVAEEFAAWLAQDKSKKGKIGGNALHGRK
jgi:hypothetical protein